MAESKAPVVFTRRDWVEKLDKVKGLIFDLELQASADFPDFPIVRELLFRVRREANTVDDVIRSKFQDHHPFNRKVQ